MLKAPERNNVAFYLSPNGNATLLHFAESVSGGVPTLSANAVDIQFDGFNGKAGWNLLGQTGLHIGKAKDFPASGALEMGMTMHGFVTRRLKAPGAPCPGHFVHKSLCNQPIQRTVDRDTIKSTNVLQVIDYFSVGKCVICI
jgi:hypothetical protein